MKKKKKNVEILVAQISITQIYMIFLVGFENLFEHFSNKYVIKINFYDI